jgi:hypothetical protein
MERLRDDHVPYLQLFLQAHITRDNFYLFLQAHITRDKNTTDVWVIGIALGGSTVEPLSFSRSGQEEGAVADRVRREGQNNAGCGGVIGAEEEKRG